MKVTHVIATNLTGGAARGAYWLHKSLLQKNVDSKILIQQEKRTEKNLYSYYTGDLQKFKVILNIGLESLPLKKYNNREQTTFYPAKYGIDITKHEWYKEADIIHLHWINNGFVNLKTLGKIDKPIVWTIRDMWPFTGGCSYSLNCEKYKTECGDCPQLKSGKVNDLSRRVFYLKKKKFGRNIYPVAISNWLKKEAGKSPLFSNYDIKVIHNGVDTSVFQPIDKVTAKEILHLPKEKKIISFGAINSITDKRKGFNEFVNAINQLKRKDEFHLLVFGANESDEIKETGITSTFLGHLKDDISLSIAYSASDVFAAPSLQEGFGKTIIESMACGTPVVAFDYSGPKDIIDHKVNGFLAKPFDSISLKEGIEFLLSAGVSTCEKARIKVCGYFSIDIIAKKYIDLYESILSNR